jgi:ABC-2 type transport system permease protein
VSPWTSLGVVGASFMAVSGVALALLRSGYKLRH